MWVFMDANRTNGLLSKKEYKEFKELQESKERIENGRTTGGEPLWCVPR